MRYDFEDIKNLFNAIFITLKSPKITPPQELISQFIDLSLLARREGILALDKHSFSDSFMKKGINFCVDGAEADKINEILSKEIENIEIRHEKNEKMLDSLNTAGPAFGMIGTLIGLVQMLTAMDDPKTIGPAMAVAILTTLYGSLFSNLLCMPVRDKLNMRTKQELLNKEIIKEGVLGIHHGENPRILSEILETYIAPNMRSKEE